MIKTNDLTKEELILEKHYRELNSMCSYLAMFPSKVPRDYIEEFTKEGEIVFDPFSGRGTTTLQAIKMKRIAISNDLSPLAYVLTKAKTYNIEYEKVFKRIKELEEEFNNSNWNIKYYNKEYEDIRVFYSRKNLTQIDFIRSKLGAKHKTLNKIDNFILALSLGIAHGQTRKTGGKNNSLYFSVHMPNGYSMSPNYAKKYINKHNLHKVQTNIFDQIIERLEKKRPDIVEFNVLNEAYFGNALESSKIFHNKQKPKLIFTSPPYLNLIKYVEQNWIRFWMLGFSKEQTKDRIVDDYHARKKYIEFLKKFMLEMYKIMESDTHLIMVIGDVKNHMIKDIMKEIFNDDKISNLFRLSKVKDGNPRKQILKNKLSRQMGEKVGTATKNDWVFIFERNDI